MLFFVTALGIGAFLASVGMVFWLVTHEDAGEVQEESYLRVALSGPLMDAPIQGGFFLEPEDVPPTTTEIAEAIQAAAADDRIDGMYLSIDGVSAGWGSLQEIRDALDVFRAADKPCVAFAEVWGNGGYYLASACDEVLMAPGGVAMVNGLSMSVTYYAGTFEKLGIEADFEHVGDFKSAVEPFERSEPSEAAAEAMDYLLDGIYDQMVAGIAAGRGLEEHEVRALIDRPPLAPSEALERGLVDGLAFPDAVLARAPDVGEEDWLASLEQPVTDEALEEVRDRYTRLSEYLKGVRATHRSADQKIAVIHAEGTITSGDSGGGLFGTEGLTDRRFREWMVDAREDEDVVAVVVRVNSPGGSGLASDMMWREVMRTQQAGKPVVISMADLAASGGYFISAPSDWIVAQPATITGSIGVFGGKINLSGLYEKMGMTEHVYKRGEQSDLFSATSNFSEDGRTAYRRFLSDFYEVFLGKVAEGRDMERDAVHAVAQGRVWTGQQALERGLVDELGGLDEALTKAGELAGVESYGVARWPERKDFFELLVEDLESGNARVELALPGLDLDALRDLQTLEQVLDGGVAAMLPVRVRFDDGM